MIDVGILAAPAQLMNVPIRTQDGKIHNIPMEGTDTLTVLKKKVSANLGVPMDQIKRENDGKEVLRLEDLKGVSTFRPIKFV
jgi:hypothetical protein